MKLKLWGVGIVASLVLAGCFESQLKNPSDGAGNCSTAFVDDYQKTASLLNQIQAEKESQLLDLAQRNELIEQAKKACLQLSEKYNQTSCSAASAADKQISTYRVSDLDQSCASLSTGADAKTDIPSIEKPGDSALISQLKPEQIHFDVLNLQGIIRAATIPASLLYKGKLGTRSVFKDPYNNGEPLCAIAMTAPQNTMKEGDQLSIFENSEKAITVESRKGRSISFTLSDQVTGIGCLKLDPKPFTVQEIRSAFKGLFEIRIERL